MREKEKSYIQIGKKKYLDDQNEKNNRDHILKEVRIRIGTLLKTDNISFLFGAGASMTAGGVSLAKIPKSLEWKLLSLGISGNEKKRVSGWLKLFYSSLKAITDISLDPKERHKQYSDFIEKKETEESDRDLFKDITDITENLETYLSHLIMWRAGISGKIDGSSLKIECNDGLKLDIERDDLKKLISKLTNSLVELLNLPKGNTDSQLCYHRRFIKKILTRPLNLRRANIFTLNYDTLIEQSADAEGAVLVDGFVGILRRVFRPESYDLDFYFPAQTTEGRVHRFDRALHLYKLHGSINWHRCEQNWENPYGLYATFFNQNSQQDDVMIYPSPLKYGQALALPYSELFRRFGNAIVQPQSVLFTIGYGFGDEHVNALIRQALSIPSFTLVIVDPDPKSDFVNVLENQNDERIWIVRGWELGTFENFVDKLLPDLREEEIYEKVMQTYKILSTRNIDKGDNDGK
jgi:hypothetical protein